MKRRSQKDRLLLLLLLPPLQAPVQVRAALQVSQMIPACAMDSRAHANSDESDSESEVSPRPTAEPSRPHQHSSGSQRSAMIDLTSSPPPATSTSAPAPVRPPQQSQSQFMHKAPAKLPPKPPPPQQPQPRADYNSIFTGRQVKALSLDDLPENQGPTKNIFNSSRPHVAPPSSSSSSAQRKPAPVVAPKNPPPSPVKTAAMAWGEERYEKSNYMGAKDVEKHLKDMVKSQLSFRPTPLLFAPFWKRAERGLLLLLQSEHGERRHSPKHALRAHQVALASVRGHTQAYMAALCSMRRLCDHPTLWHFFFAVKCKASSGSSPEKTARSQAASWPTM